MFMPLYLSTRLQNGTRSNANENYSSSASTFYYQVPVNRIASLTRIIVTIEDNKNDLAPDLYGGLAKLTNGLTIKITDKNDQNPYYLISNTVAGQATGTSPLPIKTNLDWSAICYDFSRILQGGSALDQAQFRWTFTRAGSPIILENEEKFCIVCNDDFSTLSQHFFTIQGLEAFDMPVYRDYFFRGLVGV